MTTYPNKTYPSTWDDPTSEIEWLIASNNILITAQINSLIWIHNVSLTAHSNIIGDTTAPSAPTLTTPAPAYINSNSVNVEVNWEIWASVFINGVSTAYSIDWTWKVIVALNTSAPDGTKSFSITLKDAALNESSALSISMLRSVVAPSLLNWDNDGWFVPDIQWIVLTWMILAWNINFIWATISSMTSLWTISAVSINWLWKIVFNYTTPFPDPDTITLNWTDKFWNTFSINKTVDMPF